MQRFLSLGVDIIRVDFDFHFVLCIKCIQFLCWPQMLEDFSDDLVPLIIPGKGGATQEVRVILTSSKEDKVLFQVASNYQFFLLLHA